MKAERKAKGVREAIDKAEATLLYLQPYSPHIYPIELMVGSPPAIAKAL